jgi:hypothetical protein
MLRNRKEFQSIPDPCSSVQLAAQHGRIVLFVSEARSSPAKF